MIARLAIELQCYIPEQLNEAWAQLRHLGRRRAQLITAATASVQRLQDFLSVAWPVASEACAHPFESVTWLAAMQVVTSRCGGQPEKLAAIGLAEFTALVRQAAAGWGGQRPAGPVCRAVFAALTSTEGVVVSHRRGLLRRCADELQFVDPLPRGRDRLGPWPGRLDFQAAAPAAADQPGGGVKDPVASLN